MVDFKRKVQESRDRLAVVVNIDLTDGDVYCGRPGPWGNPFHIGGENGNRENVIEMYREYFKTRFRNEPAFRIEVARLRQLALNLRSNGQGPLKLGCHCAPFKCHVDIIAEAINQPETPMKPPLNLFLAHPKSWSDEQIDTAMKELERCTLLTVQDREVTVASGRDAWEHYFATAGGWDGWAQLMATGTTREGAPLFHVYVLPSGEMGKASAQICQQALRTPDKRVVRWDGGPGFTRVTRIVRMTGGTAQNGWFAE